MQDSAMDLDGSSYYGLGKRSHSTFEQDNIPESQPPNQDYYTVGFQPPIEPKAMQLYRTCVVYVSSLAGHGLDFATSAWTWLFGSREQRTNTPTEIIAAESESGNKRRAIVRDDANRPSSVSTAAAMAARAKSSPETTRAVTKSGISRTWRRNPKAPVAEDTSDEEEQDHMSGALPVAKSPREDLPSPPNSQDDEANDSEELCTSVTAPGAFPEPSKGPTPPLSRPSSSHEEKHNIQKPAEMPEQQYRTTSRTSTAKSPARPAPSQPTRPTSYAAKIKPEYGMSLNKWKADYQASQAARRPQSASTSPARFRKSNPKLPREARDAIRQRQEEEADAPQKKQERQNQKDAKIDDLINRAKHVALESPEVRNVRSEFRRSKQLQQFKIDEEQRIEREKIEREQEEARIKAALEEEAKRQAELEAEEERKRSERLVPELSEEWIDKVENALATGNEKKILAKSVEGVELSKYDLERLYNYRGSTWLNDETVNAWFAAIVKKKNQQMGREYKRGSSTVPYAAAYNSMWFGNYKSGGIDSIKNWSRRKGIQGKALLKAAKVFFPINTGAHWTLLVVSPTARRIEFLDSLGGRDRYAFKAARQWLAMELGDAYKAGEWSEAEGMSSRQLNGDDCGVFACINGFASAKGVEFGRVESVKGMMDVRQWMVAVLLNGGFEGEFEL